MTLRHTFIIALACVLAACSGNGEQDAATGTRDTLAAKPIGAQHWVDENTLDALPEDARNSVLRASEPEPAEGAEFVALVNKLNSDDAPARMTAARAISLTMGGAKGDYHTAIQNHVPRYLGAHSKEFLDLFHGPRNMGKVELMAWANVVNGGQKELSTSASELMRNMKTSCRDCSPEQSEVLDLFIGYVTGEGGKKGGLK